MSFWWRPCCRSQKSQVSTGSPPSTPLDPTSETAILCHRLRTNDPHLTTVTLNDPAIATHVTQALLENDTVRDVRIDVAQFLEVNDSRARSQRRPNLSRLEPILHYLQAPCHYQQQDAAQHSLRELELTCSFGAPDRVHLVDAILLALCEFGSSDGNANSTHHRVGQHIQALKLNDSVKASPAALERFLSSAPSALHILSFDLDFYTPSSFTSIQEYEGMVQAFSHMTSTITTLSLTLSSLHDDFVTPVLQQLNIRPHIINLSLYMHGAGRSFPFRPTRNPSYTSLFAQLSHHVTLERLTVRLAWLSDSDVASLELFNDNLPNLSMFHLSLVERVNPNVLVQALSTCNKLTRIVASIQETRRSIEVWSSILAAMRLRNVSTSLTIPEGGISIDTTTTVHDAKNTVRLDRPGILHCANLISWLLGGGLNPNDNIMAVVPNQTYHPLIHSMQSCTFSYRNDTQTYELTSLCCNRFNADMDVFVRSRQGHLEKLILSHSSKQETRRFLLFVRQNDKLQEARASRCARREHRLLQAMVERNRKLPLLLLRSSTGPTPQADADVDADASTREDTLPFETPAVAAAGSADTAILPTKVPLMPGLVRASMPTPRVSHRHILAGLLTLPNI